MKNLKKIIAAIDNFGDEIAEQFESEVCQLEEEHAWLNFSLFIDPSIRFDINYSNEFPSDDSFDLEEVVEFKIQIVEFKIQKRRKKSTMHLWKTYNTESIKLDEFTSVPDWFTKELFKHAIKA